MGSTDGKVIGVKKIYDSGSTAERFNLVLVAEGYRESELATFAGDCQQFISAFFNTAPFDEFRCAFNVFRIDVASTESGADDPKACGGSGATPKTYFDATFCNNGVRRSLVVNDALVQNVVSGLVPAYHSAQVIVNTPEYGGTGGTIGVSSNSGSDWRETVIHEMGHSIFGLQDEYEYLQGCNVADPGHDKWTGSEPAAPNVTKSPTAAGKWSDLLTTQQLPTTTNADCTRCDPQPNPVAATVVGTFEGAYTYHCGVYRPQFDCKMRKLGDPFCRVCTRVISEYLRPFDPRFCARDSKRFNPDRWALIATILFGVIQDGGGVIIIGGRPIPIDPWGPLRHSLWAALADPRGAPPATRDLLATLAIRELVDQLSEGDDRARLTETTDAMLKAFAAHLDPRTIR